MEYRMNVDEVLLYVELKKKLKKPFTHEEFVFMLYSLKNYEEVKLLLKQCRVNNINLTLRFIQNSLVYFIEDFNALEELKNWLVSEYKNIKGSIFIQQILLAETREQTSYIIKQAEGYKIHLNYEFWIDKYNSVDRIKKNQQDWKKQQEEGYGHIFSSIFLEFHELKTKYFKDLSLEKIKDISQNKESASSIKTVKVFSRSVYIKEFAKRVAAGICQLCEEPSPFKDKMNEPFLEVHHVRYLSQGGPDSIENVVALCPNCHKKVHVLETKEDFFFLLEKASKNLEI